MMTREDDIVRTKNRTSFLLKELGPARPGLGGKDLEGMLSFDSSGTWVLQGL